MALVTLSISTNELATVRSANNAKEAWLAILQVYEAKDLPGKLFLRRKFFNIRLESNFTMQQHINNIKNIVDQLKSIGSPVTDDDISVVLLNSLDDRYDALVISLESRPADELNSSAIAARLLQEERRRSNHLNDRVNDVSEPAFFSKSGSHPNNNHGNNSFNKEKVFKKKKNNNYHHSTKTQSHHFNGNKKPFPANAFIVSGQTESKSTQQKRI